MARYCWSRESAFDFIREKVMNYCNGLPTIEEQIRYLRFVLLEKKNYPPELDENLGLRPTFEEFIQNEIDDRKEELTLRKLCPDKKNYVNTKHELIWWKGTEPQIIYFNCDDYFHLDTSNKSTAKNKAMEYRSLS